MRYRSSESAADNLVFAVVGRLEGERKKVSMEKVRKVSIYPFPNWVSAAPTTPSP